MKNLLANSWIRTLTGVGIALLAGEFLAPRQARASCGDYVTFGTDPAGHSNSSHGQQGMPEKRHQGKAPCHGPWCGGNDQPAPTPPTTTPVRATDWACLLKVPFLTEADPIPLWAWLATQSRTHRTLAIYHPPRPF